MLEGLARRLSAALLASVAWLGADGAAAQAPSALSWVRESGAESCIGAPELGERVERLVGPVLVAAPAAEVSVEGHIAREGQRFVATIVISNASGAVLGVRELLGARAAPRHEPDCRALDDQLAFVIAVAIDPNVALAELPGELAPDDPGADLLADLEAHPPGAPAKSTAVTPPAALAAPVEAPEPAEPVRVLIAAGPALSLGVLPEPAVGVHGELGAAWWRLALRGHLRLVLDQEVSSREGSVALSSLALGAAVCVEPVRWHVSLALCGGVQGARLAAQAVDFPGDSPVRWLLGPRLELRAALALTRALALVSSAALSAHRPRHRVSFTAARTEREIFQVPAVAAELQLLFEARFDPF